MVTGYLHKPSLGRDDPAFIFHRPLSAIRDEGQTSSHDPRLAGHGRFVATAIPFLFHSSRLTGRCLSYIGSKFHD